MHPLKRLLGHSLQHLLVVSVSMFFIRSTSGFHSLSTCSYHKPLCTRWVLCLAKCLYFSLCSIKNATHMFSNPPRIQFKRFPINKDRNSNVFQSTKNATQTFSNRQYTKTATKTFSISTKNETQMFSNTQRMQLKCFPIHKECNSNVL